MSGLSREQIEALRGQIGNDFDGAITLSDKHMNALCDMALRSLAPLSATEATSESVCVPREPTKAMRERGEDAAVRQYDNSEWDDAKEMAEELDVSPIWKAMLAAAPAPAQSATAATSEKPVLKSVMSLDMELLANFYDYGYFDKVQAALAAAPAPAQGEPVANGNPLLWNVHCMFQQAERGAEWESQWRDLLAAIEQHLQRVDYPNAAPTAPVVEGGAPSDKYVEWWSRHPEAVHRILVDQPLDGQVYLQFEDCHGREWAVHGDTLQECLDDAILRELQPYMKPSEGGK